LASITDVRLAAFDGRVERARRARATTLIDLTESDPGRCGLSCNSAALDAERLPQPGGEGVAETTKNAIARYLLGHGGSVAPECVILADSLRKAYQLLLSGVLATGDEMLVPWPGDPILHRLADGASARRYPLRYDGTWRLDKRALKNALTSDTRAIIAPGVSCPTGVLLTRKELTFLEDLCAKHGLILVGDERFADTSYEPPATVVSAEGCLAIHVASARSICGTVFDVGWLAIAGPEQLVRRTLQRPALGIDVAPPQHELAALPDLLDGRESFLSQLRQRISRNRASLATAALREAPWTVLGSGGGWWAVLEIGAANDEEELCISLLDEGVVVRPGFEYGFEANGYLVLSLLPTPETFCAGLDRLDACLRKPL